MANVDRNRTIYYGATTGSDPFANVNASSLYKPGELGTVVIDVGQGRRGQLVQLDSGCTAATATGIAAAGQVLFWKDKSSALVTNDANQANAVNAPAGGWGNAGNPTLDARNFVMGIAQLAVTAGYYTIALQRDDTSNGFPVKSAVGGTYNAGVQLVPNAGTAADATSVAAGTAATTLVIGTVLAGRDGNGKVPCWVNIKEQD